MLPTYQEQAISVPISVGSIDVILIDPSRDKRVLILQRGPGVRSTGAWEVVHGTIEPGEKAEEAALREVREETGLVVDRLYNLTSHAFYLAQRGVVNVAVVFVAFADSRAPLALGREHSTAMWVGSDQALSQLAWPATKRCLTDALELLSGGNAGPLEDVLRVPIV